MRAANDTSSLNWSLTAMQNSRVRNSAVVSALTLAAIGGGVGCHELTEQPASQITPQSYFTTDQQVQTGLAGVYSGLRPAQGSWWQMSQASSDETIVPTRGSNWKDGGQWVELWTHTYGPNSGAGTQAINGAYADVSSSIAKANANIQSLQAATQTTTVTNAIAEMRGLRAYFYLMLMDAFGGVPIVTAPQLTSSPRAPRDSVARFIEAELHAVRSSLPATIDASNPGGRLTQGGVDAILSNLYTNWPVYTGTVSASGLTPGQTRYDSVLAVTGRILNSGQYALSASWSSNFSPTNQGSKENIFVVRNAAQNNLGLDFPNRTLHYNSFGNPGGWNGFSTIADVYNTWDNADARKNVFLVGPQKRLDTGAPTTLQDGVTPLDFTPTITSLNAAGEGEGIRNNKFSLDPSHSAQFNGNDFTIFRLANVYLDRAEAYYRTGQTGQALALINQLRGRVYSPASPLAVLNDSTMQTERLHETFFEGKRRQDMIRFGIFDGARQFKTASPGFHVLMPIPTQQIQANPLLTQNPGY